MIIVFHTPVVSGFQLIEQAWPSMKTSPGPGLVGSGSACTNIAADEAKMVNARAANMFFVRKDLGTASAFWNERLWSRRLGRLENKRATSEVLARGPIQVYDGWWYLDSSS
jgi:hypothetical protein